MEYSIKKLSVLAGVSARTLRYYDQIGLLRPKRTSGNDYRVYTKTEVDLLQQIMFFRELGVSLFEIKNIIYSDDYDVFEALKKHVKTLKTKRKQIDSLIINAERTIESMKGGKEMSDKEKFEGFKQKLIDENEKKYGEEVRKKYGDEAVEASNAKLMGLTREQYAYVNELSQQINSMLKTAFNQGDPSSELAQKVCELHKEWLCFYWKSYSKEAHRNLAQTYVDDPRFRQYYDNIAVGCAEFLHQALQIYCN